MHLLACGSVTTLKQNRLGTILSDVTRYYSDINTYFSQPNVVLYHRMFVEAQRKPISVELTPVSFISYHFMFCPDAACSKQAFRTKYYSYPVTIDKLVYKMLQRYISFKGTKYSFLRRNLFLARW